MNYFTNYNEMPATAAKMKECECNMNIPLTTDITNITDRSSLFETQVFVIRATKYNPIS